MDTLDELLSWQETTGAKYTLTREEILDETCRHMEAYERLRAQSPREWDAFMARYQGSHRTEEPRRIRWSEDLGFHHEDPQ